MRSFFLLAVLPLLTSSSEFVDRRLKDVDPSVSLSRFTGYPVGAANDLFVPNTNFWARGIDFPCASPWNSGGGALRAGTLISRRHIIFARHFPLWKGVRILFVDNEGQVCPCRIEATKTIDRSDIMVGLLDAEVTPNIHPAKILPPDAEKYIGRGGGFPVVTFDQRERLFLTELKATSTNGLPWRWRSCLPPKDPMRLRILGQFVLGDSGNPAFLLIGDEPILLYCLHSGGCGAGPDIHLFRREIQAAMDELCPGYRLKEFDFGILKRNGL